MVLRYGDEHNREVARPHNPTERLDHKYLNWRGMIMGFYQGQEVNSSEVNLYNQEQIRNAKQRCLNTFLNEMNGKIEEGMGYVYTQDPSQDCRGVYNLIEDYKICTYSDYAEQVITKEVKETKYTTSGYSGTIDSNGDVKLREDYDSETVKKLIVDRIDNAYIRSNIYYVLCKSENVRKVIDYINNLSTHYHGYQEMEYHSISSLSKAKNMAPFAWFLAFIDSLLCLYLFFPFAGQMAAFDTYNTDHIFTLFKGQAYLFWILFAVSMSLKVIAFILGKVVMLNGYVIDMGAAGYLVYNYVMFPITVAAIFIMISVWNNNPASYGVLSIIAFILFIRYGLSAIIGIGSVFMAHNIVSVCRINYRAASQFIEKYKDKNGYDSEVEKLKMLIMSND